jgi:hypothetical protein
VETRFGDIRKQLRIPMGVTVTALLRYLRLYSVFLQYRFNMETLPVVWYI